MTTLNVELGHNHSFEKSMGTQKNFGGCILSHPLPFGGSNIIPSGELSQRFPRVTIAIQTIIIAHESP